MCSCVFCVGAGFTLCHVTFFKTNPFPQIFVTFLLWKLGSNQNVSQVFWPGVADHGGVGKCFLKIWVNFVGVGPVLVENCRHIGHSSVVRKREYQSVLFLNFADLFQGIFS